MAQLLMDVITVVQAAPEVMQAPQRQVERVVTAVQAVRVVPLAAAAAAVVLQAEGEEELGILLARHAVGHGKPTFTMAELAAALDLTG